MSTTSISRHDGRFDYFDAQLSYPAWEGKRVLELACGGPTLLAGVTPIRPDRYRCLEISDAHVVVPGPPVPDLGGHADLILSFSAFDHLSLRQLLDLVPRLEQLLAPGGMLAFTFLDPHWIAPEGWVRPPEPPGLSNLHWRLARHREHDPGVDVAGLLARAAARPRLDSVSLVGGDLSFDPDVAAPEATLRTVEYVRELFPAARILPPVTPERVHCAVISSRDRGWKLR